MRRRIDSDRLKALTSPGEKILELLRATPGEIVSGEKLRSLLNVSRTAIWKQINLLRDYGYSIESLPSQGYRLLAVPSDQLIPAEITAGLTLKRLGKKIVSYSEIDSTNVTAFQLAEAGEPEGSVVIADCQRRGKGRLGRGWESPSGVNVYCSIILRPSILPVAAFQFTFLSAVAVARSVEKICRLTPEIKWPNDILIKGKKIAGLLNEMSAETEKVNFLVLGIGVNLNMRMEQFPLNLRHPASSLMLEGVGQVSRTGFIRCLLAELDDLYDSYINAGYGPVRDEWQARCNVIGRKVRVTCHDTDLIGLVTGIDESGGLLLTLADGNTTRILAGDVTLI